MHFVMMSLGNIDCNLQPRKTDLLCRNAQFYIVTTVIAYNNVYGWAAYLLYFLPKNKPHASRIPSDVALFYCYFFLRWNAVLIPPSQQTTVKCLSIPLSFFNHHLTFCVQRSFAFPLHTNLCLKWQYSCQSSLKITHNRFYVYISMLL